ncbi:DUF2721 domain-containing protein [Pedobacter frigiditerrae]|uniref:DUF2721 domain-containing protein n=1 Tax=Pedobacter frigiditerrae TaxID=2530452 RepID=A0A4R0MYN6_9SPHI|nr:DUF2721 domain-containing protein [Pedobacter frigiditerrae]TCC92430.1 DUF2721 domain-containing protein [Pedobacter frigiditerrae]
MNLSINTPALLFPAISLIMLAYTNRFLSLASLVRSLHAKYAADSKDGSIIHSQIKNLRYRLRLIKNMQTYGICSFISCIFCMFFIYIEKEIMGEILFAISLLFFIASLFTSLIEIRLSTKALEFELSDMEDLQDPSLVQYIKNKFDK